MTVVDTSVVVAILQEEDDAGSWSARLSGRDDLRLPASCYLEAVMVLHSRRVGRDALDGLMRSFSITILGSDERQARLAADAFERFGRGTGHPARLNFGDCLAYAAAQALGAPLLFKGNDFAETDVARA